MSKYPVVLCALALALPALAREAGGRIDLDTRHIAGDDIRSALGDLDLSKASAVHFFANDKLSSVTTLNDDFPGNVSDAALEHANANAAFKDNEHAFGHDDDEGGGVGTLANPEPGPFLLAGGGLAVLFLRKRFAR